MDPYRISLVLHVLAGMVALVTFWTAAFLTKGSVRHRRVGQIYLSSMLAVLVTGVPLCVALVQRGRPMTAVFLFYLLVLTGAACWKAWRAVRDRHDRHRFYGRGYWLRVALVGCGAVAIGTLGVIIGSTLFVVFAAVGLFAVASAVRSYRRAPGDPRWWLREHYGAIVACGAATHIAFLAVGVRSVLPMLHPQAHQIIAWFAPLAVAVVATLYLDRRYGRRSVASVPVPVPEARRA